MGRSFDLFLLPGRMAICRLDPREGVPPWADSDPLCSVTRTQAETTVVCREENIPAGITCSKGWRCLGIRGVLDFSETGILSSLTATLAREGIPLYALSTYSTDLVLVKEEDLSRTRLALARSGHRVSSGNGTKYIS